MSFHSLTSLIIKGKIGSGETHKRYGLRQTCPIRAEPDVRPRGRFGNTEDEIVKSNSRNAGNNSLQSYYFNLFFPHTAAFAFSSSDF